MRLKYIVSTPSLRAEAGSRKDALAGLCSQVPQVAEVLVQIGSFVLPELMGTLMAASLPQGYGIVIIGIEDPNSRWNSRDHYGFAAVRQGSIRLSRLAGGIPDSERGPEEAEYVVGEEVVEHSFGDCYDLHSCEFPLPEGSLVFPLTISVPHEESEHMRREENYRGGSWTPAKSLRFV